MKDEERTEEKKKEEDKRRKITDRIEGREGKKGKGKTVERNKSDKNIK